MYALRRRILEAAKNNWPRLKELSTKQLLEHTFAKTRELQDNFELDLTSHHGFSHGEQTNELNSSILFKTFLLENDERLVDPNAPKNYWLGWSF